MKFLFYYRVNYTRNTRLFAIDSARTLNSWFNNQRSYISSSMENFGLRVLVLLKGREKKLLAELEYILFTNVKKAK